ncbi:tetratricopeptide repeat-containing protein, putative [Babesia ovis]|uniref:Tetratricopeptide repeat-containing protein, putative n=1 Tax=Babesia ovis TaxID=5869 RepID=A0A9W5T8X2_BABOV|nr:tetratricopeptide repeat-containing protein, putative [Babesia ovis]
MDDDDDYIIDPEFLRQFTEQYGDVDHPLFMEEIPHDIAGNEDLEALQQLLAEGETRESIAEKYKEVGNEYVQQGAYFYEAAISSYTKGIEAQAKDEKLNAHLYLNRALVHLKKKDFVKCIDDCRQSIARDDKNVKAYYRAAMASFELELYKKALSFCIAYYDSVKAETQNDDDLPTILAAGSPDLLNIYKRCVDKLRERDELLANIKRREKREKMEELDNIRSVLRLLSSCGIKLHKDIYEIPKMQRVVFYHENGCLHTSCLFIYDEHGISDYIENFDYSTTVGDQLDVMFPNTNDPKSFTRHNSKCIYETSKGEFYEFGTNETLATVIYKTKVAYRVAPVHVVHKDFDVSTLKN